MIHARSYMGNVVGARLLAICDPCEENLKKAQEELHVAYTYADYQVALQNKEIDAVIVVTPTAVSYTHLIYVCCRRGSGKV